MSVETLVAGAPLEAARLTTNTLKDVWSVMDAAANKQAPSQYLGRQAVAAVQGVTDQAQRGVNAATSA
jgi:hypothetical protein